MCDPVEAVLYSEKKDKDALESLKRQMSNSSKLQRDLIKQKVKELETEIRASKAIKKAMARSVDGLTGALQRALEQGSPESLLSLPNDALSSLVLRSGLDLVVDEIIEQSDRIAQATVEGIQIVDPSFELPAIDLQVQELQIAITDRVVDTVLIPDTVRAVQDSLIAATVEGQEVAMSSLAQRLKKSEGRQLTEIRTQISSYGRGVAAQAGAYAGLNLALYTGPDDGIARGFCRALVDLVLDEDQMSRLNNQQGLSFKLSGGGYNCRHSLSYVSAGFVEAGNLKRATSRDISKANARARGES